MRLSAFACTAAMVLFVNVLCAQIEDAPYIFRELKALEGTWFMPTDRGDRLEVWTLSNDTTLLGRGLRIRLEDGDTVNLESMRLLLHGDTITYYVTVRGQNNNQPVPFRLTLADVDGYLFENPRHDDPKKILYRLLGNRELQVTTEGVKPNGRPTKSEYVFEREFTPAGTEFRVRAGANAYSLRGTGNFPTFGGPPEFSWKPGWEIGATAVLRGRGSFLRLNIDLGVVGRYAGVQSEFAADTTFYVRDGTYRTTWLTLGVVPELSIGRDSRFSVLAGPYAGFLLFSGFNGTLEPTGENQLFDATNDFKRTELGLTGGFQYRLNIGKKDLGGILGLRGHYTLSNLDDLYSRDCDNPAFCNGRIGFTGISFYYSINLLNL